MSDNDIDEEDTTRKALLESELLYQMECIELAQWPSVEVTLSCDLFGTELSEIRSNFPDFFGQEARITSDISYPSVGTVRFSVSARNEQFIDEICDRLIAMFGEEVINREKGNNPMQALRSLLPPLPPTNQKLNPLNLNSSVKPNRQKINPEPHDAMICSITTVLINEPVILLCGHSFEKSAILSWKSQKPNCPICNKIITTMIPNIALAQLIEDWKKTNNS